MNRQNQNGNVHVIIISMVSLIIVGVVGYLFWINFMKTNNVQEGTAESNGATTNLSASPSPTSNAADDTGYLVLNDWGVKFKVPDNIGEVHYYKKVTEPNRQGVTEYYEFSSKRVEDLGDQCVEPNSENITIRLAGLSRSKVKTEQENLQSLTLVNEEPINGYYYYTAGAQSICSDKDVELQAQDRDAIYNATLKLLPL